MKKRKHGGCHIQYQIGLQKKFLAKNGELVHRHKDALTFVLPQEAADYMRENKLGGAYAIVDCDCPPSEW